MTDTNPPQPDYTKYDRVLFIDRVQSSACDFLRKLVEISLANAKLRKENDQRGPADSVHVNPVSLLVLQKQLNFAGGWWPSVTKDLEPPAGYPMHEFGAFDFGDGLCKIVEDQRVAIGRCLFYSGDNYL